MRKCISVGVYVCTSVCVCILDFLVDLHGEIDSSIWLSKDSLVEPKSRGLLTLFGPVS